jgi:hypothetical protein
VLLIFKLSGLKYIFENGREQSGRSDPPTASLPFKLSLKQNRSQAQARLSAASIRVGLYRRRLR